MIKFKLSELAALAGAVLHGRDLDIESVSTASGDIGSAGLFIALKGERHDAHAFIPDALSHGAVALGVERGSYAVPYLTAADTLSLLGAAGLLVRSKCPARIGAVTGSCGKTTTKEMAHSILSQCGRSMATAGNFNNDVGVPLTLLRLSRDLDSAVIEQGASHLGDIARTAAFVRPEAALITTVGRAHIEGFGSFEGVYRGKSEILDDVFSRDGIGIVPGNSVFYPQWCQDYAAELRAGRLLSFGDAERDFIQVVSARQQGSELAFTLRINAGAAPVLSEQLEAGLNGAKKCDLDLNLRILGRHNAYNAAAACALALALGAPVGALQPGLAAYQGVPGRLCATGFGQVTLIDDAYNASFDAVKAGLEVLSTGRGLRIFIFGDMGELGSEALRLHELVGEYAKNCCDLLLCKGRLSAGTAAAFGRGAQHFDADNELIAAVLPYLKQECTILVKGSHSMHMDRIAAALAQTGDA